MGNKFDDRKKRKVSNHCWQDLSNDADLVYVGDMDEILYHPLGLSTYFEDRLQEGYNVFKPHAYEMVNINLPKHEGQIYDHDDFKIGHRIYDARNNFIKGRNPWMYDKCSVFSPKNLDTVWFSFGFHKTKFTGTDVKICYEEDYKLLHYKYIGRERFVKYNIADECGKRINKNGVGSTYKLTTEQELYNKFDIKLRKPNKKII